MEPEFYLQIVAPATYVIWQTQAEAENIQGGEVCLSSAWCHQHSNPAIGQVTLRAGTRCIGGCETPACVEAVEQRKAAMMARYPGTPGPCP